MYHGQRSSVLYGLTVCLGLVCNSLIYGDFIFPGQNTISYSNLENIYTPDSSGGYSLASANTVPVKGDILQGVIWASQDLGSSGSQVPGTTSPQITGVFSTVVQSVYSDSSGASGIVLAPDGAFSGANHSGIPSLGISNLPANTMIAFFTDPANGFISTLTTNNTNVSNSTITQTSGITNVQTAAESGQLVGAFGYGQNLIYNPSNTSGNNLGSSGVGYWFANDLGATPTGPQINYSLGLQLLQSNLITVTPQPNSNFESSLPVPTNSNVLAATNFDLVGTGQISSSNGVLGSNIFSDYSSDPMKLNAQIVPEPSSCILLALGGLGLLVRARRRRAVVA